MPQSYGRRAAQTRFANISSTKPRGDDIFTILKAFGMELKPQLYTRGEIREMKATASPF